MRKSSRLASSVLVLAVAAGVCSQARAGDDFFSENSFFSSDAPGTYAYTAPDETVRLRGSLGVTAIDGDEYVFSGNYTVSHLIWQTKAPVLRGSVSVDVGSGFSVNAEGGVAALGTSHMDDYDWLAGDDSFDNWTDHSSHDDTHLDHYWTGSASLGYELAHVQDAVIRLHGGFEYTDVQWSAYGGNYTYSVNGFRDTTGNFPAGVPGVTYRQQLPEVFIGVDGDQYYGNNFRVGGLLRAGVTMFSTGTDNHWMRNLLFIDSLKPAATFTAGVDAGYKLTDFAEFVMAARYEQIFQGRGDTSVYDTTTGALVAVESDSGAGELRSIEVTAGFRGNF